MSDPQTSIAATNPEPIQIPSGDEIYDALMSEIEMDLITTNLPVLDEKYSDENPADREARYKRYQDAYAKYDIAFEAWMKELHGAVEKCRRDVAKFAEQNDKEAEQTEMTSLEAAFETATPK